MEIKILELSSEEVNLYCVPDRYLNTPAFQNKLYLHLLPGGKRNKTYEKLAFEFVCDKMESRKKAKFMEVYDLVFMTIMNARLRESFRMFIRTHGFDDTELAPEARVHELLQVLYGQYDMHEIKLPDNLREMLPFPVSLMGRNLELLSSEEDYNLIKGEHKDIYDLCVNLVLCSIPVISFQKKFLDQHPWLIERQSKFYQALARHMESHEDSDFHEDGLPKVEFMANSWSSLAAFVRTEFRDIDNTSKIGKFRHVYSKIFNITHFGLFTPGHFFDSAIRADAANLKDALDSVAAISSEVPGAAELDINGLNQRAQQLFSHSFIGALFDSNLLNAIRDFDKIKDDLSDSIHAALNGLHDDIGGLKDLREQIQDALSSGDMVKIASMVGLSSDLEQRSRKCKEYIEVVYKGFNQILDKFELIIASEIKIDFLKKDYDRLLEESQAPDEALLKAHNALEDTQSLLAEKNSELQEVIEKSNAAFEDRDAALDQVDALEAEVRSLKEELHKQSLRAGYQTSAAEQPTGVDTGKLFDSDELFDLLDGNSIPPARQLEVFQAIAPDRVVILPSAFKSAEAASNFQNPGRLAVVLRSLLYPYLDAIREGKGDSIAKSYLNKTYAAKESDTTMQIPRMRSAREFEYNGEVHQFVAHVGVGRGYGTQNTIRIQFKVIEDRIVIAHCGEHLETGSTN